MKRINQILATFLALLLLCGMVGCGGGSADFTQNSGGTGVIAGDQDWVPVVQRREGVITDQGYYYVSNNNFIHFMDTQSGVVTALCSKAGCLHADEPNHRLHEKCDAHISGAGGRRTPLCVWNGSLYYLINEAYGPCLYRCDAAGNGQTMVSELGTKYTKDEKVVSDFKYAMADGFWYYYARVDSIVWDEEQFLWTNQTELEYISRIDLATGEEKIITEVREDILDLCGARGDAVLFTVTEVSKAKQTDPSSITLHRWDEETGNITTVFQKSTDQCSRITRVENGKAYCGTTIDGKTSTYTYDLATGEEEIVFNKTIVNYLGGGYVLRREVDTQEWYVFQMSSEKVLPIELPEGTLSVSCTGNGGCILQWSVDLGGDTGKGYSNSEHRECYVSYASLADGLQESDLMRIYTWENG